MKHVHGIQALKDRLVIRYSDDDDPPWIWGREVDVAWKGHPNVRRLASVACDIFHLLLDQPDLVEANDEVLQEWLGKHFQTASDDGEQGQAFSGNRVIMSYTTEARIDYTVV